MRAKCDLWVIGSDHLGVVWSSLPSGSLPAGWLMKLRQLVEKPGFCPRVWGLETGLASWGAVNSPLGPLCADPKAFYQLRIVTKTEEA